MKNRETRPELFQTFIGFSILMIMYALILYQVDFDMIELREMVSHPKKTYQKFLIYSRLLKNLFIITTLINGATPIMYFFCIKEQITIQLFSVMAKQPS